MDVKSGTGPRFDIELGPQLRVPTSPIAFGAAALDPGIITFKVGSRVGDEVEAQVGMKLEMSETP